MSGEEADLKLLLETNDTVELATVRSLLDGHGIQYVVQGEHHSSMLGGASFMGNPAIVPRVLVAQRDLEQATSLLNAQPDAKVEPAAAPLEGAECPVHLKPAIAACGRCGTFLCGECKALGNPPLCEDCDVSETFQRKPKEAQAGFYKKALVWTMLGGALLAIVCGGGL